MTAPGIARDQAMEARVARTLEQLGLAAPDVARVVAAHRLAMEPRRDRLGDPHHPDFLHPGRVVLILAVDAGVRDPLALAAGALVESERPELRVGDARIRPELGPVLADLVAATPLPGEGLPEELVTAPTELCLVALAERLDQCRHAKFWAEREAQERVLAEAENIYGPVAARVHDGLARRYAHWARAFARSLARNAPGRARADPRRAAREADL